MPFDSSEVPFSASEDLAYLRLLHLSDSALPIGSLAHSFGLETLTSAEILHVRDLSDFLCAYLQEAGMLEAVACREALRLLPARAQTFPADQWIAINDSLSARKPARESRAASATMGRNFLYAVMNLGNYTGLQEAAEASRKAGSLIHQSAAFGLASAALQFDGDRAVLAYLHQMMASLVSACQRLLPLGQSEATRILWNLKPAIAEISAQSAERTLDTVNCTTPLLDWGAMEHPALATRLFVS